MLCSFIDSYDNLLIESVPLFKGLVKGDLAKLTAHSGLSKLNDGVKGVLNTVRGELGVDDLDIEDAVDEDADIVLGDGGLVGDRDGLLLERVDVGDLVNKGDEQVDTRLQGLGVLAEPFNNKGLLLRYNTDAPINRRRAIIATEYKPNTPITIYLLLINKI